MKVLNINIIPPQSIESDLFIGGPVTIQPLINEKTGKDFNMTNVNFQAGSRNKFHTHTSDQVLIITAGTGIVATENSREIVTTGDLIHIPAWEKHWHGATADSYFSHISLTLLSSISNFFEE